MYFVISLSFSVFLVLFVCRFLLFFFGGQLWWASASTGSQSLSTLFSLANKLRSFVRSMKGLVQLLTRYCRQCKYINYLLIFYYPSTDKARLGLHLQFTHWSRVILPPPPCFFLRACVGLLLQRAWLSVVMCSDRFCCTAWRDFKNQLHISTAMHALHGLARRKLSICPSVCLFVWQTHALWQNGRKICRFLYHED